MDPYLQIASVIRATVLRGKYVPRQQMPPIRTLAERVALMSKVAPAK